MTSGPPPSPGPRLYLIRHGETAWSLGKRHTGKADIALTVTGEAQARQLAPWLASIAFSRVLTSPRQRARRTCELAGLGADPIIEPDLAEWDYGHYEGESSLDIDRIAAGWDLFRDGCPGGESPSDILERADRLIGRLCAMDGNVALFSHGQFGCALAARWAGLPVSDGRCFWLSTASLSIFGFNPNHPGVRVIDLWNAVPRQFQEAH